MALTADLDIAIKAVCPISGVSIGNRYDRSTWLIRFLPEATEEERAAAQQIVDTFPLPTGPDEPAPDLWKANVENRLKAIEEDIKIIKVKP